MTGTCVIMSFSSITGVLRIEDLEHSWEKWMHLIVFVDVLAQIYFIAHAVKTRRPWYWIGILLIPWIGFMGYLFLEFLPELKQGREFEPATDPICDLTPLERHTLAYISQGKLFHKCGNSPATEIQSPFGQKVIDRTIRAHQKDEWKTQGSGSHFGGSVLWGVDRINTDAVRVNVNSVTRDPDTDQLYYLLFFERAGGLFVYDYETNEENRLFHKENFYAKDLDLNPKTDQLVCSQGFPNSISNIVVMNKDGSDLRELTGGDAIDEAPSWIPGERRRILFQSSGVARNKDGFVVGKGPTSIQALDLDDDRLTSVLEDSRYDFLLPHISPDGFLYFIRRPYEIFSYSGKAAITDFFLFPFRLIRAVFHFLNFFSLVFSKKPLTTASGPKLEGDDLKTIVLRGKVIDAEKTLRKGNSIMGVPSLVPSSWELIRRSPDGRETAVARNVAAFDISRDGTIVFSNGCGIYTLDPQEKPRLLLRDHLIEDVLIG